MTRLDSSTWASQPVTSRSWLAAKSQGVSGSGAAFLHAPSFAFQAPGGGENQLLQTGRHLEDLGVPVRLFSAWTDRLENARVLHLFGMSHEGLALARIAKARGVAVVLSPIIWYEPRALTALETNPYRRLAGTVGYYLRQATPKIPSWRRALLHLADRVLPNSESEARQLVRLFGVPRERIRVVPNGVLPSLGTASPELFHDRFSASPFVLFVGRIEPRKNPLALIRAIRALDLPLVVIGEAPPGCERYWLECRRAGSERVCWLGGLENDDPLLASAYAAAKVFALPSWFETPGLAALEAALAGCAIMITPFGSTRDYFGDLVEYARPNRAREIERGLHKCWNSVADPRLARLVATRYLWPDVAQATAEVYDQVAR
jgi:glycosyltransferase involved in cell wall biosynthesis